MKNLKTQGGSALSIVLIVIVIIIIAGIIFFYAKPDLIPKFGDQKTYNHPSGLFSFKYPADLEIAKFDKNSPNVFDSILGQYPFYTAITHKDSSDRFSIEVDLDESHASDFEKSYTSKKSTSFIKKDISIGGLKGYRIYEKTPISGDELEEVMYVFPLAYNTSKIFLYEKINTYDSSWLSKLESVAQSLKVDLTKVPAAEETLKNSPIVKTLKESEERSLLNGSDAQVKALMAQFRSDAETAYNSTQGYTEACTTYINNLKVKVNNNLRCNATTEYFILSVLLPTGGYYCADSTGYMGKATSYHTGKACVR